MSRIGKLPVILPDNVKADLAHNVLTVSGPQGELTLRLPRGVKIDIMPGQINVAEPLKSEHRSFWGLTRTLIDNLVKGVTEGFAKQLEIQGVGYRAQAAGQKLTLALGYSHPVEYDLPEGISATVETNIVTVKGIDKQKVGQVAAELRALRPPEPYKGKGIRYVGEIVRRKVGKAAGKAAA